MKRTVTVTSKAELARQAEFTRLSGEVLSNTYINHPKAYIRTYGCQQNVSDSQKLMGMLTEMGYALCDNPEDADFIIFNTCAVRGHAEDRVFGNVGALKPYKLKRPGSVIALCGCMMQQQQVADKIYKSYPFVDLVFGTHMLHKLPELLYKVLTTRERVFELPQEDGSITEGIPVHRDGIKGWLPVMYGCDNFCTYCIVPHVRGRERSRMPKDVLNEAQEMIKSGFKDITLLGQNVNSYRPSVEGYDFSRLIRDINALDGEFWLRFMTSHPKDCTTDLLDAMKDSAKVARHLHLPFQCGSDRILKAMNRGYTSDSYLKLITAAKERMPDLALTSDVIVGFPGETYEDFKQTLALIKKVEFTALYTFIFSPREGTPAAKFADPIPKSEKSKWFEELLAVQEEIAEKVTKKYVGTVQRILVEGAGKEPGHMSGRAQGNLITQFKSERCKAGDFCDVKITNAHVWSLSGELV